MAKSAKKRKKTKHKKSNSRIFKLTLKTQQLLSELSKPKLEEYKSKL